MHTCFLFNKLLTGRSLVIQMVAGSKFDMRMYPSQALCCAFTRIRADWSCHTPAMSASKCCGTQTRKKIDVQRTVKYINETVLN
jgi:hypothetical protein